MDLSKDRKRSTHIVGLRKPMEGRTKVRLYVLERSIRHNQKIEIEISASAVVFKRCFQSKLF